MQAVVRPTRSNRCCSAIVAATAAACLLSAVVLTIADDGRTPWFDVGIGLSLAVKQCNLEGTRSARCRCLRHAAVALGAPAQAHIARATRQTGCDSA